MAGKFEGTGVLTETALNPREQLMNVLLAAFTTNPNPNAVLRVNSDDPSH